MMPFLFGPRDRRLFGAYDAAHKLGGANRAAIICAPWGNEYIFAHRTLRQLALRLSQKGFHVIRFDYYATGDSAGACEDATYASSRADVETALTEIKEITGISKVCVIGLRFGASVAADVAARNADLVEALILWEPLSDLDGEVAEQMDAPIDFIPPDLETLASRLPSRSLVLATQEPRPATNCDLQVNYLPCESPWIEKNALVGRVPLSALQHIVAWLT